MAELLPLPLARLVTRAFEELERQRSIFDLPVRKFVLGHPQIDTSVDVHRHRVAAPLGPSAGPHTAMAQNIVLGWLGGARVFELKTVQVVDSLQLPRPCIDARTVGYNVEWSQELKIEQSLEEYVKASMLIEMLGASGKLDLQPGFDRTLFDVSLGYDLAGIRSGRITAFLGAMLDATSIIDRLRRQLPSRWRDFDFRTRIADTVTLSTFHGCPAEEIEEIADYLMSEVGVDCTLKLNPTLLGFRHVIEILHDRLGFHDIQVPRSAFENELGWPEALVIISRLRDRARWLGRSFAVKLTNTLVVENASDFLPRSETFAYLSGSPLHLLAMHLVRRFRRAFGDSIPLSFSAGIDRTNYPDAVALGLAPVTVCTDLLKQGGYGRLQTYAKALCERMESTGAASIDEFIRGGRPVTAAEAKLLNTEEYVERLDGSARYRKDHLPQRPHTRGEHLDLLDCSTCDLCIPACPNSAIFRLPSLGVGKKSHQIACFAELCNDCGNCEVFCPDHGAPNALKFRLFLREEAFARDAPRDAFLVRRGNTIARGDACTPLADYVERAVFDSSRINYFNCGEAE